MDAESIKFRNLIMNSFSYLISDFDFKLKKEEDNDSGYYITFMNDTTGVRISYVPRDGGAKILLYKLINGELPEYPIFINDDTELNQFYIFDLIVLRNPNYKKDFPGIFNSNKYIEMEAIEEYGTAVKEYAADILRGDFTVFSELEKIVKARARKIREERK